MHLFLTGERGVGKSTALRRALTLLGVTPGGFQTYYGPDHDRLFLDPAWEERSYDETRLVARMAEGQPVPKPAAFDRLAVAAIRDSIPWAKALLFDECGKLEREAVAFQKAVLDALDAPLPILGVIKPDRAGSWLMEIERHPAVRIITVTKENRGGLPAQLAECVGNELWAR